MVHSWFTVVDVDSQVPPGRPDKMDTSTALLFLALILLGYSTLCQIEGLVN
jgi:hypothetical protein